MTPLFSSLFCKIRHLLASRAENQRLKVIREALRDYGLRRGVNLEYSNNKTTNEYE